MSDNPLLEFIGVHVDEKRAAAKRITNAILVGVPALGSLFAIVYWIKCGISALDISLFLCFYLITGIGIGIGFHRFLTHQSFETTAPIKWFLLIAGAMAFQGSPIRWVADHRRHHRFSDHDWDPHSPVSVEDRRFVSRIRGIVHAHCGWLFDRTTTDAEVYAPDLLRDPVVLAIERWYPAITMASLLLPAAIGYALGGLQAGISGLLFGGCLRTSALHNVIWAVNSLGHGPSHQESDASHVDSTSRNSFLLAFLTFGEGWHHNHHSRPRSAYNCWHWYQIDFNGALIWLMGKTKLATRIVELQGHDGKQ